MTREQWMQTRREATEQAVRAFALLAIQDHLWQRQVRGVMDPEAVRREVEDNVGHALRWIREGVDGEYTKFLIAERHEQR